MRLALVAALAAAACALSACGSSGSGSAPQGNPDTRHGPAAVDAYASVELLRAQLIASSDSYYAGGSADDARQQLARARASYDLVAERVRRGDAVVDREVVARFNVLARDLRHGVAPDHYRDIAGPLADQLMDGVQQALVPAAARSDRGLQAEALRRVVTRMSATYDAASAGADDQTARLAFEDSWGLWRRSQALASLIKQNLGDATGAVTDTLNNLRGSAFPNGPSAPTSLPTDKVDAAATKVVDALTKRFRLDA